MVLCVLSQALSILRSISLDQCYRQVENLTEKLEGLKQRFGLSSAERLVHSTHLEMEKVQSSVGGSVTAFSRTPSKTEQWSKPAVGVTEKE